MAVARRRRVREKCPHCGEGSEVFRYLRRQYVFDVDHARQLVSDGRQPVEVDQASVQWCVDTTRIYPRHVNHVDIQFPGIIAHVYYPLPDGTEAHGHVLIDGNHRAARCIKLGKPFLAYLLTPRESRRILLKSPRRPRGWRRGAGTAKRARAPRRSSPRTAAGT